MINKIIEELEEATFTVYTREYENVDVLTVQDAIEIVKKHENDGWILCSDELPKEFTEVWITNDCSSVHHVYYSDGKYRFGNYTSESYAFSKIIAWKPFELQQPYKGE